MRVESFGLRLEDEFNGPSDLRDILVFETTELTATKCKRSVFPHLRKLELDCQTILQEFLGERASTLEIFRSRLIDDIEPIDEMLMQDFWDALGDHRNFELLELKEAYGINECWHTAARTPASPRSKPWVDDVDEP